MDEFLPAKTSIFKYLSFFSNTVSLFFIYEIVVWRIILCCQAEILPADIPLPVKNEDFLSDIQRSGISFSDDCQDRLFRAHGEYEGCQLVMFSCNHMWLVGGNGWVRLRSRRVHVLLFIFSKLFCCWN